MARATMETRDVALERLTLAIQKYITKELLEDVDVRIQLADMLGGMAVAQFKRHVWAAELANVRVEYPADWWQAVKRRWFPRWALRRWPAVMTKRDFKIYDAAPGLVLPGHKNIVRIAVEQ